MEKITPRKKTSSVRFFFLISHFVFFYLHECEITPGYQSDHSGVLLKLQIQENEKGRGYWKFNNALLKDKEYIKMIKNLTKEVLDRYDINNINKDINIDNFDN